MIETSIVEVLERKARQLRVHCLRTTSEAGSGHPTSCMSAADLVAALFFHVMRYDPQDPDDPANDRFVLSKGHAAPLLYAAWAEAGAFPVEQLDTLRKLSSELEGHPTPRFRWAEVASGSLGQGLSLGLGIALNGKYLDKLDYKVYVLLGDGECAEGSVWEAAALARRYKLDNLVALIDVNGLGQSQRTMYEFDVESYRDRFDAFGWFTLGIDGHNFQEILSALEVAQRVKDQPVLIAARTKKGKGVSFLEDRDGWHGKPVKKGEELERALAELNHTEGNSGADRSAGKDRPTSSRRISVAGIPSVPPGTMEPPYYRRGDQVATREAYGTALVKLGDVDPRVVALDGDVKNSTFAEKFLAAHPDRYFEMFIAEQNMVGAAVGLSTRGKVPFVSTFAAFLTRAFDHIRMSAISRVNIKYVGSHAGVSIGEDGPSQMGLEDLAMMRAVPGSVVLYPSDAVAAERAVELAARYRGICYIRTNRPKTPVLYANEETFEIGKAKLLRSTPQDRVTVVAAGVTLLEALRAWEELQKESIAVRVVDLFSVKPLDEVLLRKSASETSNLVLTVEDHYADGGLGDAVAGALAPHGVRVHKLAVREIPTSGKPEELLDAAGISARHIVQRIKEIL
ncbi:MAG: transketolase [Acidobacteria bacterium]|nr:transketolase [Acidobacteriota bacterium]